MEELVTSKVGLVGQVHEDHDLMRTHQCVDSGEARVGVVTGDD